MDNILNTPQHNLLYNPFFSNIFDLYLDSHECLLTNEESFINKFAGKQNPLLFGMNLGSLNAKFDQLKDFIDVLHTHNINLSVLAW